MKKMRVFINKVAMIFFVCMFFTACTGTPATDESNASQPAPSGAVSSRDTINLTVNQVCETLNSYATSSLIDYQVHYQTYEGMFFCSDSGEFESRVCKDYSISEDGMTYTVTLNDAVKFHNGKDVTAEDVAWSLNFMARDGSYITRRSTVSVFEDAKVIDDKTIEIKTKKPSASFFASISTNCAIFCKDEFLAAEANGTLGVEWVPMGTGPYVITSYNPDSMVELEAFPDYYRGEAQIKHINYQVLLDNNSTTIAFEAGDLDFIAVPTASWSSLSSNPNYVTYLSPTAHVSFFECNINKGGPLANKLVRQAIAYGMDREAMCAVAYDGIAEPAISCFNANTVFGGFTAEELEAADIPTYEYKPEKAKELLAEAGYSKGVDIGSILCINGSYWEKMSTVFQDNMKDIGVTVNIELADSAACRSRRAEGDYDLATTGTSIIIEANDIYRWVRTITPEMVTAGDTTDLNVNNEKLEEILQTSMITMDHDARRKVYLELTRELNDQLYLLFTFHKAVPYAYNKDLVCDEINTNGYFVYNMRWN